jgi:AcrR family transcriptional regulator
MATESKSNVERRVLEAATQVFFARGFHNSSLREIAKRAGTSESGVLRFYQGRLHLLQCVYASCWTEINENLDRVVALAAEEDPDPRNLLVHLMRAILNDYHAAEPRMHFMLTTFGLQNTAGYSTGEDLESDADSEARRQYHRYLTRIHDLCDAAVAEQPIFTKAGLTGAALAQLFIAMCNGVQGGWYAAKLEPGIEGPMLATDEALQGMKLLLYQEGAHRHDKGEAR